MSEFLKNKGLSTYFLLDALLPEGIERKALWKKLAGIFCLGKQSLKLYGECEKGAVQGIKNVAEYNRHLRMTEYNGLQEPSEECAEPDPVTEEVISVKGKILTELMRLKIKTARETNGTDALLNLTQKANTGITLAMYAYGVILCEGLGVEPDAAEGVRYLKKVADWGNIEACIACIYYCRDAKNEYGDKLYTYFIGTPYSKDMDVLSVHYGLSPKKDEIAALTCKLFAHHVAVSEQYDWQLARILNCGALGEPDKQDIALSGGRDTIKRVSALPLNLKSWDGYRVKPCAAAAGEESERKKVELALKNIDTLGSEKYRPLCICSDDAYMLNAYLKVIEKTFSDCNVFTVDVSEADTDGFYKLFCSEILRGIKESMRNVAVIAVCGQKVAYPAVSHIYSQTVHSVLNTQNRRAFKAEPNVPLNLTELLPVILCDRQNLDKFRAVCHVVRLSDMTEADKRKAIEDTVKANAALYELNSAKIEDDALERLVKMKSNEAVTVLDKLFAAYDDGEDALITLGDVNKNTEDTGAARAGF